MHEHSGYIEALCECECGTRKLVRIQNLIKGYSKDCGCGRKKMLTETKTKDLTGQRYGKLVAVKLLPESDKYKRRKYLCKCDCGNEVIVPSISLISGHTNSCGCLSSVQNMNINLFLTELNINHKAEYTVCINGTNYRFDFYLPDYNLMIEYDGEQHYSPSSFGEKDAEKIQLNFQKTKINDEIKNKYCKDNNINLLRIPYWEKDNIKTIISNYLQRLNREDFINIA